MREKTPIRTLLSAFTGCAVAVLAFASANAQEASPGDVGPQVAQASSDRTQELQAAYETFNRHCTQCHVSVADPERPGKTRDEWYRIIALMQTHGLSIAHDDADVIVELLYQLRQGIEEDPG